MFDLRSFTSSTIWLVDKFEMNVFCISIPIRMSFISNQNWNQQFNTNSSSYIREFFLKLIFRMFFVSNSICGIRFQWHCSSLAALKQSNAISEKISKERIGLLLGLIDDITPGNDFSMRISVERRKFHLEIESMIEQREFFRRYCNGENVFHDDEIPMFAFLKKKWSIIFFRFLR